MGPLVVWKDGRELPVGAPKQRAVLALLLLRRGELLPTATIVDLLWGDRPPATATKTVQVYVSQLRKTLGADVVETRPLGYSLRVDPGSLDLDTFEELLGQGRRLVADGRPPAGCGSAGAGARPLARSAAGGLPLRGIRPRRDRRGSRSSAWSPWSFASKPSSRSAVTPRWCRSSRRSSANIPSARACAGS